MFEPFEILQSLAKKLPNVTFSGTVVPVKEIRIANGKVTLTVQMPTGAYEEISLEEIDTN